MAFALSFIGALLIVLGFQNTYAPFGTLVAGDFTGKNNFVYWLVALGVVGAIGYAKDLQGFSRAFMGLIIVVMILANKGFFSNLESGLSSGTSQSDSVIGAPIAGSSGGASATGGSGGSSSFISTAIQAAPLIASIF
jgi:hypothetical protein